MSNAPEGFTPFFERLKEQRAAVEEYEEEQEYTLEVIEPSRPARPSDLNTSLAGIISSLALCGWWSASQVTRVLQVGLPFKTGERAGEMRPDKELTNVFIHAAHPDGRLLKVWYIDGRLNDGLTRGPGAGNVISKVGGLEAYIEGRESA